MEALLEASLRLAAPLLGSPLAYAAVAPGRQTAPGQPDRTELERLLRERDERDALGCRALRLVESRRGVVERSVELIHPLLARSE